MKHYKVLSSHLCRGCGCVSCVRGCVCSSCRCGFFSCQ